VQFAERFLEFVKETDFDWDLVAAEFQMPPAFCRSLFYHFRKTPVLNFHDVPISDPTTPESLTNSFSASPFPSWRQTQDRFADKEKKDTSDNLDDLVDAFMDGESEISSSDVEILSEESVSSDASSL